MSDKVKVLADLSTAELGSYYTIAGAGGDLDEWVDGLTGVLVESGIGAPTGWYSTTVAAVNDYAKPNRHQDAFKPGLTFLMFPLDGLDVGRLAILRLQQGDRWFDDMVTNMRGGVESDER